MAGAPLDLAVINGTVVLGGGRYRVGVGVKDGKVAVLATEEMLPAAARTIDAKGNYVLPGVIDSEAHPGCYVPFDYDMKTESRAAAAAGITTWGIQAPTTRLGTKPFKEVVARADVVSFNESFPSGRDVINEHSHVDAYLTYMVETDQHAREIPQYAEEHGVTSFKLYLQTRSMKGMSDDDDTNWPSRRAGLGTGIDDGTVFMVMEETAHLGYPGIVHIHPENWEIGRIFEERLRAGGRTDFGSWTDRSPDFMEAHHIRSYAYLAMQTPGRVPLYLQHCTTRLSFEEVARARAEGLELYAQTGPPWLWAEPEYGWRINVPLRRRDNIEALWVALAEGIVDVVGSDHVVGWGAYLPRRDVQPRHMGLPHRVLTGGAVPARASLRGRQQGPHQPGAGGAGQQREPGQDLRAVGEERVAAAGVRRRLRDHRPRTGGHRRQGAHQHPFGLVDHGRPHLHRLARHDHLARRGQRGVGR